MRESRWVGGTAASRQRSHPCQAARDRTADAKLMISGTSHMGCHDSWAAEWVISF